MYFDKFEGTSKYSGSEYFDEFEGAATDALYGFFTWECPRRGWGWEPEGPACKKELRSLALA